jgi:hypothetical protein
MSFFMAVDINSPCIITSPEAVDVCSDKKKEKIKYTTEHAGKK